ncbi:hypothetical protein BD311DRAFT_857907 [Dichomitus squalens]|uniref:Uncharacterized protein n=1 Tax=Dichomitus squalens TaxID=114155 RepID=A0A4Q9MD51_9APHY|nr:hypothetical protein BD311DRAFT_857907 [Dichomitus squalens]
MRNTVSANLAMSGLPWIPEDVLCPLGVGHTTMAGLYDGTELIPLRDLDEEEEDELAWLQGDINGAVVEEDEGEGGDGDGDDAEGNDDADGEGGVDGAVGSEESSDESSDQAGTLNPYRRPPLLGEEEV